MKRGIIYKFTILHGCNFNGHKPYYVGQHWTEESDERFKSVKSRYLGSGKIWLDFVRSLKSLYPNKWKFFVKREILCVLNKEDKVKLNKLEEYFIKKENSLCRNYLGGCNYLKTSNIINPFFKEEVRNKQKELKRKFFATKRGDEARRKMRENHYDCSGKNNPVYGSKWINNGIESKRLYLGQELPEGWEYGYLRLRGKNHPMYRIGKNHPMYGKKLSEERRKMLTGENNPMYGKESSFKGKHHSDRARKILSIKTKRRMSNPENNPMFGKLRITNGIINTVIDKDSPIPEGFWHGMTMRKRKK